jgi:regulator of sigma E protease
VPDFALFVVVLATLLLAHEFGHFIAAKLTKVRVDEFGIGFPPRLLTLFEAGGTKFSLNLIPFGGFNRIAGEDDPEVPDGLAAAKKRVRVFVLSAGSLANIFVGLVAFVLAFKYAAPDINRVIISEVVESAPADKAGIQVGDLVMSVDGKLIDSFEAMVDAIQNRPADVVQIVVDRDGQEETFQLAPRIDYPSNQGPIGVTLGHPSLETTWPEAVQLGGESIVLQIDALLSLPGRLLQGAAEPEETRLSGLKGIHDMLAWANEIDRSAQRPFLTLNLVGVISVGLALANLLPFPALDGGRLLFVFAEAIFRRRVPPKFEAIIHTIGFAVLLALMIYINLKDFTDPLPLP